MSVVSRNVQSGLSAVSEMVQRSFNGPGYDNGGQFKAPKLVKLGCAWLDHSFMTFVSLNFKICNTNQISEECIFYANPNFGNLKYFRIVHSKWIQ